MDDLRKQLQGSARAARVMLQGSGPGFRGLPVFAPENEGGSPDAGDGPNDGDQDTGDGVKTPGLTDGAETSSTETRQSDARSNSMFSRAKSEGESGDTADDDADGKAARPENVPDKFWDNDKGEVRVDALTKAYSTLEAAYAKAKSDKGFKPPEKDTDYFPEAIELPKEASRAGETIGNDDPGLQAFQKVAFKYGLPVDVARGIVKEMFVEMNDVLPDPVDPDAEFEKLGKNAEQLVTNLDLFIGGLERDDVLQSEEVDFLYEHFGTSAVGIKTLLKLRSQMTDEPMPTLDPISGASMGRDEWQAEYNKALDAGNERRMQELDAIGEKINGNQPGMSSNLRARMR